MTDSLAIIARRGMIGNTPHDNKEEGMGPDLIHCIQSRPPDCQQLV